MEEVFQHIIDKFSFWQVVILLFTTAFCYFLIKYGRELINKCTSLTLHFEKMELRNKKRDMEQDVKIKSIEKHLKDIDIKVDDIIDYLTKGK